MPACPARHRGKPVRAGPWYLLALAVSLGGAALLVAGLLGVKGQVDGFQRVPLPQGGQVRLAHSGSYVLYYEAPVAASGQIPSFNVTVAPRVGRRERQEPAALHRGRELQLRLPAGTGGADAPGVSSRHVPAQSSAAAEDIRAQNALPGDPR